MFKNALCLASIPERHYSGLSIRYRCCQRRANHGGPHKSWSRVWKDGDNESEVRLDNGPIAFVPECGGTGKAVK